MTDHRVHHSDVLQNPHGFWGRDGGVSPAPWDSLNCGLGSDDARSNVIENRDRVRCWLGAKALQNCHQIHSASAHLMDAPLDVPPEGDGLVTTRPGLAIAALAADCVPILFEDSQAGVIGACHAGWRGAVGGIIEATFALMQDQGAKTVRAAVGPCIGPNSFEVQADFETAVLELHPDAKVFFRRGESLHFDLPAFVSHRLSTLGVKHSLSGYDSYAEPERLFSFRYSQHTGKSDFGRNISAIMLPA